MRPPQPKGCAMSIQSGIEAIRRFQVLFNDLAGLADALQEVASLEGMADAHKSAAATAQADAEKAKAEKAKAEESILTARAQAQSILDEATAKAQEQAKAAEAKASETAAQMLAAADKKRLSSEAKAKDAEKRADLAEEALRLAKHEHAALTKQMEAMREIAKSLG